MHPANLAAVQRLVAAQFWVVRSATVRLSRERAGQFYAEHEGKFFHNRLVTFMSSGACQPLVLAGRGAVPAWREAMGPTRVLKARFSHPESIRGRFGLTDTRNCSHGSDSAETAAREIEFFFPTFDTAAFLAEQPSPLGRDMDWAAFQHASPWVGEAA
jgi:nucleoside-diphosphate kinase